MFGWIIVGVIVVPFLVMSIFLLNGKGAFLIAGFNTMSSSEKATYDENALCKAVGRLLLILTVLMCLWPLAFHLQIAWLFWVSFVLFMTAAIGFAVYANTGNRFRKPLDPDAPYVEVNREPMSRLKKAMIAIGIIISIQFFIGIGVMIYLGERDPRISIHRDRIQIRALYGRDIYFSHIAEISLIESSMNEIGTGSRTNGYNSGGPAAKGYFSSAESGQQVLFVYATSSPTIKITQTIGFSIFISFRNSDETVDVYHKMSQAFRH